MTHLDIESHIIIICASIIIIIYYLTQYYLCINAYKGTCIVKC